MELQHYAIPKFVDQVVTPIAVVIDSLFLLVRLQMSLQLHSVL